MSPVKNEQVIFNAIPTGIPIAGETLKKVTTEIDPDAPLADGSVLLKTLILSLDPYLRGRMRSVEQASYSEAYPLGKTITNFGVSEVVKSAYSGLKEGDKVYTALTEFSNYFVVEKEVAKTLKVLDNKENLPWSVWVSSAGMPGQTAWWGLNQVAKVKKGETIFVSAASGAVGQMVIALSKNAGLKVIASAGSDEKVDFIKSIGADIAFNYKKEKTFDVLSKNPFDVYWDNVGGEILDAALATINEYGRIVACGAIAGYNGEPIPVQNIGAFFSKSLKMEGFIIIQKDLTAFYNEVPPLIASGAIKLPKENITKGLDQGEALINLFTGDNFGKAILDLQ